MIFPQSSVFHPAKHLIMDSYTSLDRSKELAEKPSERMWVTATAYSCYCDACGRVYDPHDPFPPYRPWVGTVAVSRDLIQLMGRSIKYGSYLYRVRDLIGTPTRHFGVDFWMNNCVEARKFGVRKILIEVEK
jgi:3D (Asp-Asp-Asp) domain-containing protein